MNHHYRGLFENWEIGVAKNVIKEFKNQWTCLKHEDDDDLLQECLTQWVFAKDSFEEDAGASCSTFMAQVVRNKLWDIVKSYNRNKRIVISKTVSIDQPLSQDKDSSSLADILPCNSVDPNLHELKNILPGVLSQLSPQQKSLCEFLLDGVTSITDLGMKLGINRKTVYREIDRIRQFFSEQKLEEFLD